LPFWDEPYFEAGDKDEVKDKLNRLFQEFAGTFKGAPELGVISANIVLYTFPLAAIYLAVEKKDSDFTLPKLSEVLEELRSTAISEGKVEEESSSRIKVSPGISLNWNAIYLLIASVALFEVIRKIPKSIFESNDPRLSSLLELHKKGVSLDELKEAISFLGRLYRAISDYEIEIFEKHCEAECNNNKPHCRRLGKFGKNWSSKKSNSVEFRHFKAHAGLEESTIEGRCRGDKLFLRYKQEYWEKIKEELAKVDF